MSKFKYGPWACTYTSNYAHDYRLTNPDGSPLPVNAEANDRSKQRAYARLIAAAPELLAALQVMLRDYTAVHDIGDVEMQPAIYQARAAIAKATGSNQ